MGVIVKTESEIATLNRPARVLVYHDGQLITEVTAKIESQPGADGGLYPCVIFEKKEGEERFFPTKKYIVFIFINGDYRGGWTDVLKDSSGKAVSFDTITEAEDYLSDLNRRSGCNILNRETKYQIVNLAIGKISKAVY